MKQTRKYAFSCVEVRQKGAFSIDELCNGITVINQGNAGAWFNNIYLSASPLNLLATDRFAGESAAIGGNEGEILTGRVQVDFATGTQPRILIIQKYYLPE